MSKSHLLSNAHKGHFDAAVQVFLNYSNSAPEFEKNEELAADAFENVISILESNFYLNELTISNFKKILDLKINIHKNLTVFIGENGVGKTSLLEAIRKNLMWIAATTRKKNTAGGHIDEDEVNNMAKQNSIGAYIDCEFRVGMVHKFKGRVARSPEGVVSDLKSELTEYRELGQNFRILNSYKNIDLPMFAFYGIDRLQKAGGKSKSLTLGKIDGYDDSLNSKATFGIFLDWLIQQLKLAKGSEKNLEIEDIKLQIQSLLEIKANKQEHPLHAVYLKLISDLKVKNTNYNNLQAQKTIQNLEVLFKDIYCNLEAIQLINEDDGNDKVAFKLETELIYLHQFSDGQRVLFGLIGDIARRLILLNDSSSNPFEGRGVVLIDEIELHLHPRWQQKVILILQKSFPNLQFIVTTHSPHILSTVDKSQIRIIKNNEIEPVILQTKGVASSDILEQIMGTHSIPIVDEAQWVYDYLIHVQNNEYESTEAIDLFKKLINHFGDHHPVISSIMNQIKIASIRKRLSKGDRG